MAELNAPAGPRRLADLLRTRQDELLARWEREVLRRRPGRPALLPHLPGFLRQLPDLVSASRDGRSAALPQHLPIVEAVEGLELGADLDEVVIEYAILRECITRLAHDEPSASLAPAELAGLHKVIDLVVAASVERHRLTRERRLEALERTFTAALGVRDVEGFLPRLLAALLETTPSIDSASLLLVEDERLQVKAAAGLALPPEGAPTLARGECVAGRVWETREAQVVGDAQSDPRVTTDILQRRGTRAIYGVPLQVGSQLIGVALMGSSTAFAFPREDLLLFRTAASRISALIAHRRESEDRESLLAALGDLGEGFAVIEKGRVTAVNDALCRFLGRTREEVLALPSVLELVPPEQRAALGETLSQRALGDGARPGRVAATLLHRDGHPIEVELGVQGRPRGRLVVVIRDVTARKAFEREAAEERARLEAVLRILPVGVAIAEAPTGKLLLSNNEERRLWAQRGGAAQTIEEYDVYEGYWPDGRLVAPNEWPLARAVQKGLTTTPEEIHILGADGTLRITEQKAAPVHDAAGSVVAGVVTVVDVTERKRIEEELRAAVGFRDQMMNILAHDLRQPLSVVSSSAQLLLRKDTSKAHQPILERQLRTVERMGRMIDDLLDFARARKFGGIPVQRKPADLHVIVQSAVDSIQSVHPERRFTLESQGDCRGLFDADRMLQVVGNLLGNALAYSPEGTGIDVALEDAGDTVVARVHNLGEVIPPERLATLFEPFRRGTSRANPGGLGLGLFIVQQIVAAHGGTTRVDSTPEGGTTFTLRLPKA